MLKKIGYLIGKITGEILIIAFVILIVIAQCFMLGLIFWWIGIFIAWLLRSNFSYWDGVKIAGILVLINIIKTGLQKVLNIS